MLRNNIIEEYLLFRSWEYVTCPKFNLYRVKTDGLNANLFSQTEDNREIRYLGTIPPENIKLICGYNTQELNDIFLQLNNN